MLTNLHNTHIKELSCVFDPESKETFISLYFNTIELDEHFVQKRINACRSVLKSHRVLLDNFDKTIARIEPHLDKKDFETGQRGLAVFASEDNGFFKLFKLPVHVNNTLIVDASPYIRPLAELIEEYENFGLIVLDSHRAKIFVVSSGMVEDKDKLSEDIMNKHKKGGWSQARFQRLRKGAIEHFLKEVTEDAQEHFVKENVSKIVIAGPGEAKIQLQSILPFNIKSKITGIIDASFDEADGCLLQQAGEIVSKEEKETVTKNVARLREGILRNGLAVYGLQETMEASHSGKLALLLVDRGLRARGWVCEKCQVFGIGSCERCPECSGKISETDVVEEIIELAERTDTRIEFVDDNPVLTELGGIGGLLRFK